MTFPIFQMRRQTHRAPVTCKAFPSSQGGGGRRAARIAVTRLSLSSTKATLSSHVPSGWPLGHVMTLKSYWSQTQTPQNVLERGKVSALPCFRVPSLQVCHPGLSPPSCPQGAREGRKLWLGLQGLWQVRRASRALRWGGHEHSWPRKWLCPWEVRRSDL